MRDEFKLRKNHKFLSSAGLIKQICQPLNHFNIHLFTYLKKFPDGGRIYLSSDPQWITDYYDLALYKSSLYESGSAIYQPGYNIWQAESDLSVFKHGREYFNSWYGFTACHQQEDGCEYFFFSLAHDQYLMFNVCLNNLDLFDQFIFYFKEKITLLLKKFKTERIFLPRAPNQMCQNHLSHSTENLRVVFSQAINGNSLAKWLNKYERLTKRENECLNLLLTNSTMGELAKTLQISKRTAETHLERIKSKLQCSSKQELMMKLSRLSTKLELKDF